MARRFALVLLASMVAGLAGDPASAAPRSRHRRSDLPPGWRWPPSGETRREGRRCLDDLRAIGLEFERVGRRRKIATPVVVPDMRFGPLVLRPTFRKPPFVMDCRLARALVRAAGPLARIGVRELRFSSIHQYRRVRLGGRTRRALSRHALGLAIDVFEIVLDGGVRVVVARDYWWSASLLVAEVWLRVTGGWRAILSPAVDRRSHGDHLHLEAAVEVPPSVERKRLARKRLARKRRR